MKIDIPEKIFNDIKEYCQLNNIDNVDKFINKILNQGFTTEKWGTIGQGKEPKKEIIEKIIISAITVEPEIKIVEKIIYSAVTVEPEIKLIEKIIYSGKTETEIKYVEKLVNTGETINHVYNIFVKPETNENEIIKSEKNIDLYGEDNIRKT